MKKILSLVLVALVMTIFFWSDLKPVLFKDNQDLSLQNLEQVGSSVISAASNVASDTGAILEQAGSQVSLQLEKQGKKIKDTNIIDNIEATAATATQNLGKFVDKAVNTTKGIISNKSIESNERARLADLAETDLLMYSPETSNNTKPIRKTYKNRTAKTQTENNTDGEKLNDKRLRRNLEFRPQTAILSSNSKKSIDELILSLDKPSVANLTIIGLEKDPARNKIAFRRTQSLANYLRDKGVKAQALGLDSSQSVKNLLVEADDFNSRQSFEIIVKY